MRRECQTFIVSSKFPLIFSEIAPQGMAGNGIGKTGRTVQDLNGLGKFDWDITISWLPNHRKNERLVSFLLENEEAIFICVQKQIKTDNGTDTTISHLKEKITTRSIENISVRKNTSVKF